MRLSEYILMVDDKYKIIPRGSPKHRFHHSLTPYEAGAWERQCSPSPLTHGDLQDKVGAKIFCLLGAFFFFLFSSFLVYLFGDSPYQGVCGVASHVAKFVKNLRNVLWVTTFGAMGEEVGQRVAFSCLMTLGKIT